MKTLDTVFTREKNRKIGSQPVWILKCPFASTGTLYFSDHVLTVAGYKTTPWISSWGSIDENISFGSGTSQVGTFSANLLIDQNTATDIGDILWTAANNIESIDCELYLWFNSLAPVAAYPTDYTADYVKATSEVAAFEAPKATDPSKTLYGDSVNNSWVASATGSQRFHIDVGSAKVINRVYYENFSSIDEHTLADVDCGVKHFTVWGSNNAAAFAELTYGTDTNWTQLTASDTSFERHVPFEQADPKYISITNTTAYRYYAFKFADNWGNASFIGVRRIVLQNVDPPKLIWTGNIVDFRQVNDQEYEVEFADQSVKKNKIVGNLLNTDSYAKIPARNVGKVGPIIYGTVTKSKAVCISCGGFTRLAEDLDTSETGVDVVDGSVFPAAGSFTINVDGEVMTCTSRSGNTLTVTRSTTPVTHDTGSPVVETSDIIYMVADHPVKAIDHVYLDGEEFTDCTKYTGQSGDEHATYTGKAIVVFNHGAALETAILTVAGYSCVDAHWTNDAYSVDDNETTYANNHGNDNSYMYGTFTDRPEFAAVKQQRADWHWYVAEVGTWWLRESMGGSLRTTPYDGNETFDGWSSYISGGLYNGPIGLAAESFDDQNVYELRQKEVQYYPYRTSGEDAEDIIVGGTITCDVDGYQDDGSGTYTGTPDALIEQPDHIFKHFLYTYLGLPVANFTTDAAASFAADAYKFGIAINEPRTAKEWLAKMAWECRCYFRWALGNAYLIYRPDSLVSDKTITAAMIGMTDTGKSSIQIERSPLDEVTNKVRIRYARDYSQSGDDAYSKLYEVSDTASITRYGEKENVGLFEWDFVNASAMATDVGQFYLDRYKDRKKVVTMDLFLDNCELDFADVITVTPLSSLVLEIQKVNVYPGSGRDMRNDKIIVVGKEY